MALPSALPLRQKSFLFITVLIGLFIVLAYHTDIISWGALNLTIFFYGIGVPMFLLTSNALIDLDKASIFKIWAIIALLFLVAYFLTSDNPNLTIRRSPDFVDRGINKLIAKSSTASLKALPCFLLCYWPLNYIIKRKTGNYIVNTFKKSKWWHDEANRTIDWFDVLASLLLFATIFLGAIFQC